VERIEKPIILGVFPPGEDRTSLDSILSHSEWELQFTGTLEGLQAVLHTRPVAVVFSERRLPDGHCWKDVLQELQAMSNPPPLIVADRLADDVLWTEVLHLGAHDLLTKPFNATEVLRAVATAFHFGEAKRERAEALHRPLKSVGREDVEEIKERSAWSGH